VAAAAEMPVTILFGRSPAGLNATGESDIRAWYDTVVDAQTDQLKPALERLLKLIFAAKDSPTSGAIPERWTIEFNPLWQPTEKEQAETLKLKADTHVALVTAGIELDSEGALALAKDIPTIDVEHRQQLMEADIAAGVRPGHYPEDQQQQQNDPNADDPLPEDA
jgi:phage-related protein (TIGR01555 family)